MKRLSGSVGLGHTQGIESATTRIDEYELAMHISDRLRQADMQSYALEILLDSLRRSSSKLIILERIGYIINQILRLKLNKEDASEAYSADELDKWASRLLDEFRHDNLCCLALGNAAHLMAAHDAYGSGYLLNQMVSCSAGSAGGHRYSRSSMVLLPGPGKTGTTSLFDYIRKRFEFSFYQGKEIDYWDIFIKHGLPIEWYLNHFYPYGNPSLALKSAIECSPSTFGCVHSLEKEVGDIKEKLDLFCLLTLRDPIARSISMLAHEHKTSMHDLSLIDYIQITLDKDRNGDDISSTVLFQSRYEIFAPKWIELAGNAQTLSVFIENVTEGQIDTIMHSWGYQAHISASIPMANKNQESGGLLDEVRSQRNLMSIFKAYFEETYEWIEQEKVRVSEVLS